MENVLNIFFKEKAYTFQFDILHEHGTISLISLREIFNNLIFINVPISTSTFEHLHVSQSSLRAHRKHSNLAYYIIMVSCNMDIVYKHWISSQQ